MAKKEGGLQVGGSTIPDLPVLRIESGMHLTSIKRGSVDAKNRFLVTGSDDKTVRVWNLNDGSLIKTIRPPAGTGNEGKIFSVAISPDAKKIACGGWTNHSGWSTDIYIFDRRTGNLLSRIKELPNVTHDLAWSKNGSMLAASFGGACGVKIFSGSGYSLLFEDRDYAGDSHSVDFDDNGRLLSSSFDGSLRIYQTGDGAFKMTHRSKVTGGSQPVFARFSPDSERVAVGFNDTNKVQILYGKNLNHQFFPDTGKAEGGNFFTVAWSNDGSMLYAAGMHQVDGVHPVLIWPKSGGGKVASVPVAQNTVLGIFPLNDRGFAFVSHEPSFGRFSEQNHELFVKKPAIAEHRGNLENFLVSEDGQELQFGYEFGGASSARFSLKDFRLANESSKNGLLAPVRQAENFEVSGWKNSITAKLNDNLLKLDPSELSRSLAIAPDRKSFLLGADWNLRCITNKGAWQVGWSVPSHGPAWSVNISGDGKLGIAAFSDGTIRWYAIENGKELLALFPHRDGKRWIAWTPSGYYVASPGADDLIGWQINNGYDQSPDFYPASCFKKYFERPDIVSAVLKTLDEEKAVKLSNSASKTAVEKFSIKELLPPVVEINHPLEGAVISASLIKIKFSVKRPTGEPIKSIAVLGDGRTLVKLAGKSLSGNMEKHAMEIIVPKGTSRLSVIAKNSNLASAPASVNIAWRNLSDKKVNLHTLAIGLSAYENIEQGADSAAGDAEAVAKALAMHEGRYYSSVKYKLLKDKEATKHKILEELQKIGDTAEPIDRAIIYLSGLGKTDGEGRHYFLPYNADMEETKTTFLPFSEIKHIAKKLACQTIVMLDICRQDDEDSKDFRFGLDRAIKELSSTDTGAVIIASGADSKTSQDASALSPFAEALADCLKPVDGEKKMVSVDSLTDYIWKNVSESTDGRQIPITARPKTVPNFRVL